MLKYIPFMTWIDENCASFEVRIFSKRLEREVGIASIMLGKNENGDYVTAKMEYYAPEQFYVSKMEIEKECVKFLEARQKISDMVENMVV